MKKGFKKIIAAVLTAAMLPVSGIMPYTYAADGISVVLNPADASPFNGGRFEGWGTSLCWWANRIGYSEKLTQQAADLFFSEDGLGLDIARYNLGGGDDPSHNHITRSDSKVPGYATGYDDEGNIIYDWTADENQRNIVKAALAANPDLYVEGFSNSPPYFMTNSGCSSGAVDPNTDNLKTTEYDNFAKFIAEATKHFKDEFGIEFQSYSPMNEPDTNYWGADSYKQEGCHYDPGTSQSNMIVATRKALDAAGLNDVLVAGMDETSIDKSVTNLDRLTAEAKTALGRIDTHTYSGSKRAQLKAKAVEMGKTLWMSEVDKGGKGGTNAGNMSMGLSLADLILADMNGMQPAAWVMWNIIDKHKDAGFTAPNGEKTEANSWLDQNGTLWGVGMADHDNEKIELSQKYYVFGQFTKYINPGDTIIASSPRTLAAYNKDTGAIKIVAVNGGATAQKYVFDMSAFSEVGSTAQVIRTSGAYNGGEHWAKLDDVSVENKKLSYELPANSVTTFVIDNKDSFITKLDMSAEKLEYSYMTAADLNDCDKYFAVYDKDGALKALTINQASGTIEGDFTNCTAKLMVWDEMSPKTEDTNPSPADIKYVTINGAQFGVKGQTYKYTAQTSDSSDVTWSVSDETIATVSADGVLTVLNGGTVDVTATSATAGSNSIRVTVSDAPKINVDNVSGSASWNNDASHDASKAADGDTATFFDGLKNGYVLLDLGGSYSIEMISYAPRAGYEYRMLDGQFFGSNDGETWTELYKVSTTPVSGVMTYIMSNELTNTEEPYRYVKYAVPSGKQSYKGKEEDYNCNIAEFAVYGKETEMTDAEILAYEAAKLTLPETVYGSITLPTTLGNGVTAEWQSNDKSALTADGKVTRGDADNEVILTVTLKKGTETMTENYTVTVKAAAEGKTEDDMAAYLFVHFVGTESDANCEQIYFSLSKDGTTWTTINEGMPVLTSSVGEKGVRDPHIIRSPEGDKFFLIATDLSIYNRRGDSNRWGTCQTSGSKSIVIWESNDLVNWSEARLVKVAPDNAGCTWAPESIYDEENDRYMVFWASKTADDNYTQQRIYRSFTRDFVNFTAPEVYIEDTVSNIDTSFIKHDGVYYRFTKNESKSSIIMQKSASLEGPFEDVSTYTINGTAGNTITGYEGPTAYKLNGENKWCLLLDYYSKSQGYKPFITDDISGGVFTSGNDFEFDTKYRHGTVMPITQAEYDALVKEYTPEAETGEMIFSLDFDNEDASAPALGTSTVNGEITYADGYNGGKAAVLDGTDFIEIKGADGAPLLAGLETFTVSFATKTDAQSWWLYAAPNTTAQTYKSEKYVGVLDSNAKLTCERYNSNNIDRPSPAAGTYTGGEWKHVTVVHNKNSFSLYINGEKVSTAASAVNIKEMLGENPITYIGKANWGSGEYSKGAIDDFKLYNYAMGESDVKAAYEALAAK